MYRNSSRDYAQTVSYANYIPVDVIASFAKTGGTKPLYLRYENSEQELITVPIEIVTNEKGFMDNVEFICRVQIEDRYKEITLIYLMKEIRWVIKGNKAIYP